MNQPSTIRTEIQPFTHMKKIQNKLREVVTASAMVVSLFFVGFAHAATFNWTNTASGTFVTAANWTNTTTPFANGVPGIADTAVINLPGSASTIGAGDSASAASLQARNGTLFMTDGNLIATVLQIGNVGTSGAFTMSGGSVVATNALQLAGNNSVFSMSGGTNTVMTDVRLAGTNGVWNVSGGVLNVPKFSIGTANAGNTNNVVTISGSALVTQIQGINGGANRELWVGGNNGGSGTVILKDNAVWTNNNTAAGIVVVGRGTSTSSVGVFTIQDNATFYYSNVVTVAQNVGGNPNGTVNLDGGTMYVGGFVKGTGTGTINITNGAVTALSANANFFNGFTGTSGANSVNLGSGNLNLNLNGNNLGIASILSGPGGLVVSGGGSLTLSASNTYTGATFVGNCTLGLTNSGSLASGTSLTLSNATLQLAVAANNPTNIVTGTFATPGASFSTIQITAFNGSGSFPFPVTLIKYTTGVGLVGAGNILTNLTLASLSSATPAGDLTGYLTNNAVKGSIDLVITGGSITPAFSIQPANVSRYAGYTASFNALASNASGYHWQTNLVNIFDGVQLSGSQTATLTIANVSAADAVPSYYCVATNPVASATSTPATLTIVTPDCSYEAAIVSNSPVAYYRFNETGDPLSTPNLPAYDYAGGNDAVYGSTVLNVTYGINGPQPGGGFPGFDNGNGAAQFTPGSSYANTSLITVSNGLPAVANTATVTLMAWVYPLGAETNFVGLVINRGANVDGLTYSGSADTNGNYTLGYNWNNDFNTYGWNSGLVPPLNQWSLVALVVTPTNATVYVGNTNGCVSSVHAYAHAVQSLSGIFTIGDDRSAGSAGGRIFNGNMDEVAVFNKALTQSQIVNALGVAIGQTNLMPTIVSQPASASAVVGQNVQFAVSATSTTTLTYQWQVGTNGVYVNLTDGGQISGSQTPILTVSNLTLAASTNYIVNVANSFGSVTSIPATLTVQSGVFSITNVWNGTTLTLSWTGGGVLLQTTNLLSPWTTNIGATSPFMVAPSTNGPQMFYKVQQ